jgi:uncharacterized protein (DUF433 family)
MSRLGTKTSALAEDTAESPLIVRVPDIHGGEPVVHGTRVPVRSIVIANEQYGGDISRVGHAFLVSPDAVRAALAYYAAHRDEIDQLIEKREQDALD